MPTLQEISDRIINIVQDPAYTTQLTGYINEGIQRCASLVLLPMLESVGTVDTVLDSVETDIPVSWNYDRNLYIVDSALTKNGVDVFSSVALFSREHPQFRVDKTAGDVVAVTIYNEKLVYYYVPAEVDTLTCAFYTKPTLLSVSTDVPTCLPDFLQMKLLSSYVCSEIYDLIEDGVDGIKINTQKHLAAFNKAIEELSNYYNAGQSRPEPSREKQWI